VVKTENKKGRVWRGSILIRVNPWLILRGVVGLCVLVSLLRLIAKIKLKSGVDKWGLTYKI